MYNKQCVKRVLMTTDTIGGVWTYTVDLVKEYQKRGIEVALATMGSLPTKSQVLQIAGIHNVELFESSYKLEWMDNPWKDIEDASEWLLELELITHPDIIHLNGYAFSGLPWHAPVVVTAHSCVCSWFGEVKRTEVPSYLDEYKKMVKRGLLAANRVVVPSLYMSQMLKRYYGINRDMSVIYNGRDPLQFVPQRKEPYIFTSGRFWDEAKNIKNLCDIAPELKWPVVAAGETKKNELKNLKQLGVVSPKEIADLMGRASVFVSMSLYEPFGYCVLEAALSGCPLVLSDIESFKEIWKDAAIYVNPNDKNALKETLKELICSEKLREEYSIRAHERSLKYTSYVMSCQYLNLYRDMIKRAIICQELSKSERT
ncbi:MAG: glycosyltransferase family 4 protein [Fibrobacter sp.]|nr:glycosyltransferase family 4 protein [Fibrobacter sp.]